MLIVIGINTGTTYMKHKHNNEPRLSKCHILINKKIKNLITYLFVVFGVLTSEVYAMDVIERKQIISAYGIILEARSNSIGQASDLPHAKEVILQALAEELQRPKVLKY